MNGLLLGAANFAEELRRRTNWDVMPTNPWTKKWLSWGREDTVGGEEARWGLDRHLRQLERVQEDLQDRAAERSLSGECVMLFRRRRTEPGIEECSCWR